MEDILVKTVEGGEKSELNILQNLEMPEQQSNFFVYISIILRKNSKNITLVI